MSEVSQGAQSHNWSQFPPPKSMKNLEEGINLNTLQTRHTDIVMSDVPRPKLKNPTKHIFLFN